MRLSPTVSRKLGYYVYLYIDPFDDSIFYVGKGKGTRAFHHLRAHGQSATTQRIRAIRRKGKEPSIEVLVHGIADATTALRIEAAVIDLIGIKNLTNEVKGWGSGIYGRMEIEELRDLYERRGVTIKEPALLIRISRLFRYGMTPVELYDATRAAWAIGKDREKATYAFAVYEGIVREVYAIRQWFPAGATFSLRNPSGLRRRGRWEFVGTVAPSEMRRRCVGKSVAEYFGKSRSPFVYVNCGKQGTVERERSYPPEAPKAPKLRFRRLRRFGRKVPGVRRLPIPRGSN